MIDDPQRWIRTGIVVSTLVAGVAVFVVDGASRASALSPRGPASPCGDADGNGIITVTDALIALQTATSLLSCPACRCDVIGNNGVTVTDAVALLKLASMQPVAIACPPCASTSSTTSTTLPSGAFPLPQAQTCQVEFSATTPGVDLGFVRFRVQHDTNVGDFERFGEIPNCQSLPPATNTSGAGSVAGDIQQTFSTSVGVGTPIALLECAFVARQAGVDTSIFTIPPLALTDAGDRHGSNVAMTVGITGTSCP